MSNQPPQHPTHHPHPHSPLAPPPTSSPAPDGVGKPPPGVGGGGGGVGVGVGEGLSQSDMVRHNGGALSPERAPMPMGPEHVYDPERPRKLEVRPNLSPPYIHVLKVLMKD